MPSKRVGQPTHSEIAFERCATAFVPRGASEYFVRFAVSPPERVNKLELVAQNVAPLYGVRVFDAGLCERLSSRFALTLRRRADSFRIVARHRVRLFCRLLFFHQRPKNQTV